MTTEYVDVETGELLPDLSPDPEERLQQLIVARHDAATQEKAWANRKHALDAVILPLMPEGRVLAGEIVCRVAGRTNSKLGAERLAEWLRELEVSRTDLLAIIAAASGIKLDALPESDASDAADLRRVVEQCTERTPSARWIETAPALKRVKGGES